MRGAAPALLASLAVLSSAAAAEPRSLAVPVVGFNLAEDREGSGFTSQAVAKTLDRIAATGASSIALVVAARLPDLDSNRLVLAGIPRPETLQRLTRLARRRGLQVALVPHIWIDGGLWRGDLVRHGKQADAFFAAYGAFLQQLAGEAERAGVALLSLGVELKALTADPEHDARFAELIRLLRQRFSGVLTYSANWDEAAQVRFWDQLDLISVNSFYPLTDQRAPSDAQLQQGAARALVRLDALAQRFERPVLIAEAGYKAVTDNAREPWSWPEGATRPVDEEAQARAYRALLGALENSPRVVGVLFWLAATGTDDPRAAPFEPTWGFSPLGKRAEAAVRAHADWARQRREVGRRVSPPAGRGERRP